MDLLFKRYASPFLLVDQMISVNRLDEFVVSLVEQDNEDKLWELYVNTVAIHGKSFNEFRQPPKQPERTNQAELEAIINETRNILKDFQPS